MAKTVVVIGSGPTDPGMLGARVDSHTVVRMHNHVWQPVERYGSRYDYGLITSLQDAEDAHLAARRPAQSWLFYNVPGEQVVSEIHGNAVVLWEHKRWFHRAMAQGAQPGSPRVLKFTRGFAAVAATIEHLRPRRVVVLGMDILRNGKTGARYYDPAALPWYVKRYPRLAKRPAWSSDTMPVGCRRDGPHDYEAEAALIRELASEAGVELVWELPT